MKVREMIQSSSSESSHRIPNPAYAPWYLTRLLDRRALRLNIKGATETSSPLELEHFLVDRAGDARDLFALRGVKTRRSTVFKLMSRSIASDLAANDLAANDNGAPAMRCNVPAALLAALR